MQHIIPATERRLQGLDMLRGFAAVGVALFHFSWIYPATHDPAFRPSFAFASGKYGVDLFFMISGFVIFLTLERSAGVRDFAVSRFARLYPAFWTALVLAAILVPLNGGPSASVATIAANATMLPELLFGAPAVDGVYWTLTYEVLFYVLAAGFFLAGGRKPEHACLGWLLVSVLGTAYAPNSAGQLVRLRRNPRNFTAWAVLATAIFVAAAMPFSPREHLTGLANAAMVSGFAAALWFGTRVRPPQFLAYLGEISYGLYLVHTQIGFAVLRSLRALGAPPDVSIAAALCAAIGIAAVINKTIERPAQRWIKDRYARATRAPKPLIAKQAAATVPDA
jgi:peptidoglycan/LPS O-acetylase OafA/YrhL